MSSFHFFIYIRFKIEKKILILYSFHEVPTTFIILTSWNFIFSQQYMTADKANPMFDKY